MASKSDSSSSSGGGGWGCMTIFAATAIISGAWFWSQGADPRAATEAAMVLATKVTGGLCLGFVLVVLVIAALPKLARVMDW